ncbi:MAG: hypothetical protein GY904_29570, partial [Planctomycetaceae bacterium]|nr:hypothetical protein [Planctomycetaceae bacterium]
MSKTLSWLTLFTVLFCQTAEAQDWPQFRGPNGNGVQTKLTHPLEWGADKNIAWSVELDGGGLASPIVTGDK